MTAAGVWTYTLDNANCTVQALNSLRPPHHCLTVTTVDGTSQVVNIDYSRHQRRIRFQGAAAGSQEID